MKTNFENDFDVTAYTRINLYCDAVNCAIRYNIADEFVNKFVEMYCAVPEKWTPRQEMCEKTFAEYTKKQQDVFVSRFKKLVIK